MKSIKPGRGPSMMGGIGSVFAALFGVFWTIMAINIGGGFMAIFGLIFIGMAFVMAVYNFKNATGENRYSSYDIVDENEEIDPFNERFGKKYSQKKFEAGGYDNEDSKDSYNRNDYNADILGKVDSNEKNSDDSYFCPYCGAPVEGDYAYCNKCGKKLP